MSMFVIYLESIVLLSIFNIDILISIFFISIFNIDIFLSLFNIDISDIDISKYRRRLKY